ncbi:MAG: DUF3857 domain-containing protein [Bacteroidetes bacterium]|nr:DUF3857 domain-containing protein [Bacteroidota bacterium]
MKFATYKSIFLLLLLLVAVGVRSLAQETPSDAIYLDQVKEYTLHPDGSWDYHYSHQLKLLTYYAINSLYGEDFIAYNPRYQKLRINRCITTMADGKKVMAPENAFNELLPSFAANAPAYNHLREMAVTHTGLERGAIEDFDYTLSSSRDFTPALTGNDILWMNSPVNKLTFIIRIPASTSLNYNQFNINGKPVITRAGSQTTYTWLISNLPAALREDFRPRELQNRPRIVFSTAKNLDKLLAGFLNQDAFTTKPDEQLNKIIEKAKTETPVEVSLMIKLQDIVVNELNFQPVPLALNGYLIRNCNQVFKSNGGSELEKTVLLAAMLENAGMKAIPVAVIPDRYFSKKSGNLLLADKFLVKATDSRGENYYLSAIQNDLQDQSFFLNGKMLVLLSGKTPVFEKADCKAPALELNAKLNLSKALELDGSMTLSLNQRLNPYLKLQQDSSFAKKLLNGTLESSKINTYSFDRLEKEQSVISYNIVNSDLVKETAEHFFLKFPALTAGIDGWHMTELVSARIEPFEIPFPVNETYHIAITLPEGYVLITEESSVSSHKDFGNLEIHISQEGRTLQVDRVIHLLTTEIQPGQYPEFKAFIDTWNNKKYREAILRVGPK